MRRPTLVLVAGVLLVTLVAGCGSGARHATTTGAATPLATASGAGGTTANPSSANPSGPQSGSPATRSPVSSQQPVSGTVSYGWIIGVSGTTTVRVELARHITNSGKNQAASQYLRTHGGTVPSETQLRYINVDLGKTKTFTISSSAVFVTNLPGGGQQKLDVAQFHAWLADNLARPIPVAARQRYQGAPRYDGPLWTLMAHGSVIVSISAVS